MTRRRIIIGIVVLALILGGVLLAVSVASAASDGPTGDGEGPTGGGAGLRTGGTGGGFSRASGGYSAALDPGLTAEERSMAAGVSS